MIDYEWDYTGDIGCVNFVSEFENKSVLLLLGLSTFLYIIMFLRLIHLRSNTSSNKIIKVKDINFLFHALMCFATVGIMELSYIDVLEDIYKIEITSLIPQLLFIFYSGSNTLFTFCFVKEIRNEIINFLCCRNLKKNKVKNTFYKPNTIRI
uniref:Serpentine receptor class gamma n=1 Tax=Parastrongyloides trichosuri TaxID=131310 RepID=A0A0N4ZI04_PARTI